MNVGEKFVEYLDKNPAASVSVFEGKHCKSMVFDDATITQTKDICIVQIEREIYETRKEFYDSIFNLLKKIPLSS